MSQTLAKILEAERLLKSDLVEEAAKVLLPAAQSNPKEPNAASLLSIILFRLRRYPQALYYAQRAAALVPHDVGYLANLGLMYSAAGKQAEAKRHYEKAIKLNPLHPESLLALANTALNDSNPSLSVEYCERMLSQRMDAQLCPTYVAALSSMGRVEDAAAFAKRALEAFPDDTLMMSGRASNLNYVWDAAPEEIAEVHMGLGRALMAQKPDETFDYRGQVRTDKRLRIGFVSSDLRAHSVSFFIEPFFAMHDRERFDVYAYSLTRYEDHVSQRLKAMVKKWHDCGPLIDREVCKLIQADEIDILFDLGGLTLSGSLTVFAYKPAPVQVTYCGYPNTTGIPTIDYRIVDSFTDPVDTDAASVKARARGGPDFDARCSEKLIRLDPCFLCYSPPIDAPLPGRDRQHYPAVTFGSFNGNRKIVTPLLDLWAQLMLRRPDARFLLKTFEYKDAFPRQRILEGFASRGVDPARIDIFGPTKGIAEHLAFYERMDISLDTIPYNGTTTTCEALWMGVPTITTAGITHASRVGVSLLHNIGAPELVAHDPANYVEIALELAGDTARLDAYRANLRSMVAASPLRDGAAFSARLGSALTRAWETYVGQAQAVRLRQGA